MGRITALSLLVVGQLAMAALDPAVALVAALTAFMGAGTVMARAAFDD